MKPTKRSTNVYRVKKSTKKVARKPRKAKVKRAYDSRSLVGRLLKLKYRINDTALEEDGWSNDLSDDKSYMMSLIQSAKKNDFIDVSDMRKCNELWKKYPKVRPSKATYIDE